VDKNGKPITIPHLEMNEAWCTLGIQLAPDGNSTMEFKYLQAVATEWHDQMLGARLTHNDAVFSLQNIVMWKLIYLLTVTNQCELIMRPILKQGLSKAGIIQTFPQALTYGPVWYGGLAIPNLYTEQLVEQLGVQQCYGDHTMDMTGLLIRANIKVLKLEAGLQGEITKLHLAISSNITNSWVKHLWVQCTGLHIKLCTNIPDFKLQWLGDQELMQLFL